MFEEPGFVFGYDADDGIFTITLAGLWTMETVDRYVAATQALRAAAPPGVTAERTLVDLRQAQLHVREVAEALSVSMRRGADDIRRTAVVVRSALDALQALRISPARETRSFTDIAAARAWLIAPVDGLNSAAGGVVQRTGRQSGVRDDRSSRTYPNLGQVIFRHAAPVPASTVPPRKKPRSCNNMGLGFRGAFEEVGTPAAPLRHPELVPGSTVPRNQALARARKRGCRNRSGMTGWVLQRSGLRRAVGCGGAKTDVRRGAEPVGVVVLPRFTSGQDARNLPTPRLAVRPLAHPQLVRVVPSGATVALTASAVPVDGALIRTALAPGRPGKRGHMPCASADRLGLCALPPCASYIQ